MNSQAAPCQSGRMKSESQSPESAVRALLVSGDPPTIDQLSKSLNELAAATEVCSDLPTAIRLVNTRKFETVVVDLKLGEQTKAILERVRFSPSNHTTVAFAITESTKESAAAFAGRQQFHIGGTAFTQLGSPHLEGCLWTDCS